MRGSVATQKRQSCRAVMDELINGGDIKIFAVSMQSAGGERAV